MAFLDSANRTFSKQIDALRHLQASLDESFSTACAHLLQCEGKVVVSGMGKSGHIANKIAATLASTGTPAFFMHPGEASHGDFGMLAENDVLIAISNSGETAELVSLMPSVKRLNIPIIAITNNPNSSLAQFANETLNLSIETEACSLGLAPTSSTTATLVLGDALAIALLEEKGFTADDFAFSHPGGALGKRLVLTVADVMVTGENVPTISADATLSEALLEISSKGLGLTAILKHDKMIGVYTDGDLRRTLDKQVDIHNTVVKQVMTVGGVTLSKQDLAIDALNMMQEKRINSLIVVDDSGAPTGALNMYMLLKAGVV